MVKTPQELYREREKRVVTAIEVRVPDRVPVVLHPAYFPARYADEKLDIAFYDYDKWLDATIKALSFLQPDMVFAQTYMNGKILEELNVDSTLLSKPVIYI